MRRAVALSTPPGPSGSAAAGAAGPRPSRLRSRTAWTVLGQSIYIVCQFAVLMLLARLAGIDDVGRFGFATAVITPVYWLADLGLRTNKTTDVANLHSFADLLALRLVTTALGYASILALAAALSADRVTMAIAAVFGAAKGVEAVSDLAYGVFQRHGRMALFARSMIARGVGGLAAFAALLVLTGSVAAAFAGPLAVWAAACLAHDLPLARGLSRGEERRVRWARLWPTAVASLPLGGVQFLAALNTALPRFFVERLLGLEALGAFTAVSYVLQAANTTVTAVSRSISGHLADLFQAGRPAAVRRTVTRCAAATLLVGVAGLVASWLLGERILALLFGPELRGQGVLLVLIVAVAVLRATGIVLQAGPIARRRFATLVRLRAADLGLVAAASLLGGALAGIEGLAAGLVVAAGAQLAVLLFIFVSVTSETAADGSSTSP